MSVMKKVNVRLEGRVGDDWHDNSYEILIAKLKVICAEYGLELTEEEAL
jgi:hypothetical protein